MQCNIIPLSLLGLALAATACGQAPATSAGAARAPESGASATARPLAPGLEVGMWVWHREEVVDARERARLIAFCRTHGITRIFVQVRFTPAARGGHTLATPEAWRALLAEAREAGVKVEALDGSNSMAFAQNRAETLSRLEAVLAFHRAQPPGKGFAGIRYDIEPYTSERWRAGEVAEVMHEFLVTIEALRDAVRAADPALTIAHDIPFFYDGQERYELSHGGVTKNFHQHIQDLSDYIGVMSYRTRATGPNSVVSISSAELDYGRKLGRPVFLSLETVPLPETPQITFHGRPPEEYRATIRELQQNLAGDPAFGGLLLHQYRTIRALLEGTPVEPRR